MIQHKAELLRELETLAGNEPPMTAAQKEAVTKWVVSAKALRSPEELRMIIRNARAQESLLREIAAADPPLTPEQILQRQSALVKNADADLAAFLRNSGLAKEFLQDELTNEQDRMSFMGIALLQNGDPPMDQAALQDLFARIGGSGMKNLTDQLESVIEDVAGGGHESLDAHHLSMIQQQLMLNAHNLGREVGQRRAFAAAGAAACRPARNGPGPGAEAGRRAPALRAHARAGEPAGHAAGRSPAPRLLRQGDGQLHPHRKEP